MNQRHATPVLLFPALVLLVVFLGGQEQLCRAQERTADDYNTQAIQQFNAGRVPEAVASWVKGYWNSVGETQRMIARNLGLACFGAEMYPEAEYYLAFYLGPEGQKNALGETDISAEAEEPGEEMEASDAVEEPDEKTGPAVDLEAERAYARTRDKLQMFYVKVKFELKPEPTFVMLKTKGDTNMYSHPSHLWFQPGKHRIHFRAVGYARVTTEFEALTPGQVQTLQVTLNPTNSWLPRDPNATNSATARTWGTIGEWAAFGGGLALAGIGAACSVRAALNRDNLNDVPPPLGAGPLSPEYRNYITQRDDMWQADVRPWQQTSYVFYALGGSVALTSLLFILVPEEEDAATALGVAAFPQPGGGTLGLTGSF
jgi:hypothetical protein